VKVATLDFKTGLIVLQRCFSALCNLARIPVVVLVFMSTCTVVQAQDMEPRAYSNVPVGINFLILGYAHSEGGVAVDPSVPLTDADIRVDTALAAFVRSLSVLGRSGKLSVAVPYAWVSGTARFEGENVQREISGPGDARIGFSVNFFGAPALSLTEFSTYQQDTIIGAGIELSVPTGDYDADKLVNIGTNRWSVSPKLGISKALGPWTTEVSAAAAFYSENNDFFGGKSRKQDPIYSLQGHVIYSFGRGTWAAFTGTYLWGGKTTVDGVSGDDLQRNVRFGATLSFPLNRRQSLKLYASTGVSTRTGADFDLLGLAWQYRWGSGL
jgi:hypothetical protein